MADPSTGMPKAEMKKLLRRSFGEGMGCAVAVGENPAFGLFMMHRVRRGKAMEKMLKDEFPDAKTIRFGTAFVKEEEPKKVYLSLNRAAPGIARRLVKTFKGTGFTKVSIVSDDGVNEDHEEADETPEIADDEQGLAAAPEASAEPVTAQPQPDATPGMPPPPPAPAAEAVDGAALAKRLAGLIPRIAGASGDPALAARLSKLAKDAGVNIKTGNLNYGALYVQQLETELDGASPAPAAAAPTKGALGGRLSSLISELGKLPAGDHKAALTRMAAAAGGQIKAESLTEAVASLDQLERELKAPPPPPPPPKAATPAPTKGTLGAKLSSLISQLGALPAGEHKAALTKMATEAGGQIKADDLPTAAETLGQLERALASGNPNAIPGDFKQRWGQSFDVFRDAIETVDKQMEALGAACRKTNDPWLLNIADRGLSAVTANLKTPLMAACLEVSNTAADKVATSAAKAQSALANFSKHVASDPQVAGCDGNPFGVAVSIRGTLGPALKALEDTLRMAR